MMGRCYISCASFSNCQFSFLQECLFDVVHVNSPYSIWVQYADTKHSAMLATVENAVEGVMKKPQFVKRRADLTRNALYLAPFRDEVAEDYYRARVDKYVLINTFSMSESV